MLYTDRNAEGLVTMLENEQPKLLDTTKVSANAGWYTLPCN